MHPSRLKQVLYDDSCVVASCGDIIGGSLGCVRVQRREEQAGADTDGWEMVEHALDTRDSGSGGGHFGSARKEAPATSPAQITGAHRRVPSSPNGGDARVSIGVQPGHAESFGAGSSGSGSGSIRDLDDVVSSGERSRFAYFGCVSVPWELDIYF